MRGVIEEVTTTVAGRSIVARVRTLARRGLRVSGPQFLESTAEGIAGSHDDLRGSRRHVSTWHLESAVSGRVYGSAM